MTKKELQDYRWLRKNIEQLENELLVLEARATNVSPVMSDMPSGSGVSDKIGNIIGDIVDLQNIINRHLRELYIQRTAIEDAIRKLPKKEQCVIRFRYIDGKEWEQVAIDIKHGWAQVHRVHANALNLLRKNMIQNDTP